VYLFAAHSLFTQLAYVHYHLLCISTNVARKHPLNQFDRWQ